MTAADVRDLKPGDRVRLYDAFNGTVVRVVDHWLGAHVVVDYDHDQGQAAVYPPYVRVIA